ncbi:hypothetical protein JYU34_017114 [Plutella xylostella]|uniref:RNA-directed DNA polymerase n=1 Tax=Plutella xylostella TaxID=51655 RepID=A0ABQ7Q0F3_PLUXY|nr:hypothetical protein JYU34_017114 [Plutella xylostella]
MRGHKVVIPEKMQQKVLRELHNSHLGIVKTNALARSKFWFPGVDAAIENMINSCHICLSMRPSPPRAPVVSWPYPDKPFQRIHIDFLGPIKNEMYLVIVDAHNKWVECYNMKDNITTSMVISKLCEYMSRFGIPISVVSDNGSSFTSGQFSDFCKLNGISHVTTAVYHPASNGQAESCVKIVKKGIKTALLAGGIARDVNNRLLKYLFDYRNSVHSTTGRTPASLVFGWQPRSRLDLLTVPSPSPPSPLSDKVRNNQFLQNSYHEGVIRKDFDTNDVVLYKLYVNKNKFNWCKGLIVEKVGLMLFKIKDLSSGSIITRHRNQIILYKGLTSDSDHYQFDLDTAVSGDNGGEEGAAMPAEVQPPPAPAPPARADPAPSTHGMTLRNKPRVNYEGFF